MEIPLVVNCAGALLCGRLSLCRWAIRHRISARHLCKGLVGECGNAVHVVNSGHWRHDSGRLGAWVEELPVSRSSHHERPVGRHLHHRCGGALVRPNLAVLVAQPMGERLVHVLQQVMGLLVG